MVALKQKFKEKAEKSAVEIKDILAKHGEDKIGEVKLAQIYQGMRGITGLVTETSLLDAQEGIRFCAYSIPDLKEKLPKFNEGSEPMPEGLFHLMLLSELPSEQEVKDLTREWGCCIKVPAHVFDVINAFPVSAHPMPMYVAGVMAMQTESGFARQ